MTHFHFQGTFPSFFQVYILLVDFYVDPFYNSSISSSKATITINDLFLFSNSQPLAFNPNAFER
jgi:hypothetical protein